MSNNGADASIVLAFNGSTPTLGISRAFVLLDLILVHWHHPSLWPLLTRRESRDHLAVERDGLVILAGAVIILVCIVEST